MSSVQVDRPPVSRGILHFSGRKLTSEQVFSLGALVKNAFDNDEWPLVLAYDGPVAWIPVDDRLEWFAQFVASLGDATDEASAARARISITDLIAMARNALGEGE